MTYPTFSLLTLHSTSQLSMKVIIQLQYSLTDSRVFHDVKNITQSSLHPTQPNPTQPPTHGWTQPMTNSVTTATRLRFDRRATSPRAIPIRRMEVVRRRSNNAVFTTRFRPPFDCNPTFRPELDVISIGSAQAWLRLITSCVSLRDEVFASLM